MKNLFSGTQCEGFQFLQILDLWGISIHAVIVFGMGKNLLFKSVLGHCGIVHPRPDFSTPDFSTMKLSTPSAMNLGLKSLVEAYD